LVITVPTICRLSATGKDTSLSYICFSKCQVTFYRRAFIRFNLGQDFWKKIHCCICNSAVIYVEIKIDTQWNAKCLFVINSDYRIGYLESTFQFIHNILRALNGKINCCIVTELIKSNKPKECSKVI